MSWSPVANTYVEMGFFVTYKKVATRSITCINGQKISIRPNYSLPLVHAKNPKCMHKFHNSFSIILYYNYFICVCYYHNINSISSTYRCTWGHAEYAEFCGFCWVQNRCRKNVNNGQNKMIFARRKRGAQFNVVDFFGSTVLVQHDDYGDETRGMNTLRFSRGTRQ